LVLLVHEEHEGLRLPNPIPNLQQISEEHLEAQMAIQYPASVVILDFAISLQVLVDHWERLERVLG
jgi:hypothetical protein